MIKSIILSLLTNYFFSWCLSRYKLRFPHRNYTEILKRLDEIERQIIENRNNEIIHIVKEDKFTSCNNLPNISYFNKK